MSNQSMPNIQSPELLAKSNLLGGNALQSQVNVDEKLALLGQEEQSIEKLLNLPEGKKFEDLLKNELTSEEVLSGTTDKKAEAKTETVAPFPQLNSLESKPQQKSNIADFIAQVGKPQKKIDLTKLSNIEPQVKQAGIEEKKPQKLNHVLGEAKTKLNDLEKMFINDKKIVQDKDVQHSPMRTIASTDVKKRINPEFAQIKKNAVEPTNLKSIFDKKVTPQAKAFSSMAQYAKSAIKMESNLIRPDFTNHDASKIIQNAEESFVPKVESTQIDHQNMGVLANAQTKSAELNNKMNMVQTLNLENVVFTNGQEEVIEEISKYIKQSKLENTPELSLKVHDKDLGHIDVKVIGNKRDEGLQIEILSKKTETNNFFKKNEVSLIRDLSSNGLKITDIKLATVSKDFGESFLENKSHNQEFSFNGNDKNMGQRGQREDSQRRRDLWQQYQENRKYA